MVEWKELKEIFDTRNGYTPSTLNESFWEGGCIPWFKMDDIRDHGRILNDSYLHITEKAIKGKGLFRANSILLATSATIGEHALIAVEHLSNQRFTNFYPKKEYEKKINMRFAYYYMFIIDTWCLHHVNQGGFASVDMSGLYKQPFPIPSLEEQRRIVSILDTFTSSIENLKEQIALRRKQYEYYRDQLLDLDGKEGVQKLQLSSIASIKVGPFGSLIHKNDYIDGGIPLVNPVQMSNGFILKDESFSVSEEMAKKLSSYTLSTDDIVFARRGEIGRCAIVTERENHYICGTGSLVVRFTEKVNSKFMLYMFNSPRCKSYLLKSAIGGSMLNINCDIVGKMPIIIPSPSIQNKIVNILDTFEASIQNLEAQLSQREKQYEYYRNKLLTFE